MDPSGYYLAFAAAYVRGVAPAGLPARAPGDGTGGDDAAVAARGAALGLRLHRFKRTGGLPRVRRVLGVLRGLAPGRLVDIGSGRGVFLWPLLDAMPALEVVAIDRLAHRARDLGAVSRGGISRLHAARMDARALALADGTADVVTALEVLEHMHEPAAAAAEAVRVARGAVVVSVPSKPDDNPEHVQLFDAGSLTALLRGAGARKVNVEYVLNHMLAVAMV